MSFNKENKSTITVFDLESEKEYLYMGISPINALINTAITELEDPSLVTDESLRLKYKNQIVFGFRTMSLDKFAIAIRKNT